MLTTAQWMSLGPGPNLDSAWILESPFFCSLGPGVSLVLASNFGEDPPGAIGGSREREQGVKVLTRKDTCSHCGRTALGSRPGVTAVCPDDSEHLLSPSKPQFLCLQIGPIEWASQPEGVALNITELERGRVLVLETEMRFTVRLSSQSPALSHVTKK